MTLPGARVEPYEPEEVVAENVEYKGISGLKLIWQHGRAMIVRLPVEIARLVYELRELDKKIASLRTDIRREESWIKYWERRIAEADRRIEEANRRYRSIIARLGAYVRALRYRVRLLDLYRKALEARVLPVPLLRRVSRVIARPITWIRYHPDEALKLLEEAVARYMEIVRKAYELLGKAREWRAREIGEAEKEKEESMKKIEEHRRNIEEFAKRIEELVKLRETIAEAIKLKKPMKEILVDKVEHIMVEETFSIETGGERTKGLGTVHQAVVAEAHARTEIQPMEMLHFENVQEVLAKMATAVRNFLEDIYGASSVSGAPLPPEAISPTEQVLKEGVRYIYEEPKRHEISWPTVEVEIEFYKGIPGREYGVMYLAVEEMERRTGMRVSMFDYVKASFPERYWYNKKYYILEYMDTPPYYRLVG